MVCIGCCWEGCYDWIPQIIKDAMILGVIIAFLVILLFFLYGFFDSFRSEKLVFDKRYKDILFSLFAFMFFLLLFLMVLFVILVEYNFIQVGI
jgi:hypothetical protein